jgi:hypothetical protein
LRARLDGKEIAAGQSAEDKVMMNPVQDRPSP